MFEALCVRQCCEGSYGYVIASAGRDLDDDMLVGSDVLLLPASGVFIASSMWFPLFSPLQMSSSDNLLSCADHSTT